MNKNILYSISIMLTFFIALTSVKAESFNVNQLEGRFFIVVAAGERTFVNPDGTKSTMTLFDPRAIESSTALLNQPPTIKPGTVIEYPLEIATRNGKISGCSYGFDALKNLTTCTISNNMLVIRSGPKEGDALDLTTIYSFPLSNKFPIKGNLTMSSPKFKAGPRNLGAVTMRRR
jgi:hypothetical protein